MSLNFSTVLTVQFSFILKFSICFSDDRVLRKTPVLLNIFFLQQTHTIYLRDTITSTIYLLCKFENNTVYLILEKSLPKIYTEYI